MTQLTIARPGPLGRVAEQWQEVPLVELPTLLRISMGRGGSAGATASCRDEYSCGRAGGRFLVDDEDEMLVIHCWQRRGDPGVESTWGELEQAAALSLEQLLWHDALAALAETAPCAEAPVPAARLRLADEGLATREELLEERRRSSVDEEDAPRMGSLAFLRQYVPRDVLEAEVLPRLLPAGGTVRVFSVELADGVVVAALGKGLRGQSGKGVPRRPKPKSIDDLFGDDVDFRAPLPWAAAEEPEDSLALHELTSVFLLAEHGGFALGFHCLSAVDPTAM